MTLATSQSVALLGVCGHLVHVEADLANGLPSCTIVGLPDAAIHEARDRVRAAVSNSGLTWPARRITLNLAPATLPKTGSGFDLAIAAAVLAADGVLPVARLQATVFLGELGLDGRLHAVRGVLAALLAAERAGMRVAVVARANAREARLVTGLDVHAVGSVRELVAWARGQPAPMADLPEPDTARGAPVQGRSSPDLSDVLGQDDARRALEVAAAGGHHLLLTGPPGVGKTMLAERLPGLLPPLELSDALEVTAIHSIAGALPADGGLVDLPPFQAAHHSMTPAALVGGGSPTPRPGLITLAHPNVLK